MKKIKEIIYCDRQGNIRVINRIENEYSYYEMLDVASLILVNKKQDTRMRIEEEGGRISDEKSYFSDSKKNDKGK